MYYYWLRKLRQTAAASMTPPQLVKLAESGVRLKSPDANKTQLFDTIL
jgi:hypothetical protein